MLMNWPSFSAAPRILDNLSTSLETFASLNKTEPWVLDVFTARRMSSPAAPMPIPAASPSKSLDLYRVEGGKIHASVVE